MTPRLFVRAEVDLERLRYLKIALPRKPVWMSSAARAISRMPRTRLKTFSAVSPTRCG